MSLDPKANAALDRSQARSLVLSQHGIVATEHPLASQAGAMILARGGHAVDAAVAANAAMGLFSPMMCGIGGDLFAIVYEAETGNLYGLNASGWAPQQMSISRMKELGHDSIPIRGIHPVTVPGAVDGWSKLLERFGNLTWPEVLAPAIHHAEAGFPVTELVAGYWEGSEELLKQQAHARQTFLKNGKVPRVGELFRNPDLAWSYRQIAAHGRKAFYEGTIARRILGLMGEEAGLMKANDLTEYSSQWVDPISTTYREWTVYEIPPNGQGIAALIMLNLMEGFPLGEYGHNSTAALHTMIEAKKLAYADLMRYIGDPAYGDVPVEELLSKEYARRRRGGMDPDQANCQVEPGDPWGIEASPDTTYLCAVDGQGNMVSLIQSIYYGFGSGLVAEGTGFVLQNRGALFSLDPDHPNALEGHKRPLHTIIPGFMTKGEQRIAFGIMGGWNQPQAHAQFVSNIVDHGMNLQAALEAARFTKMTFEGCDLLMEGRVPENVRSELAAKGHEIEWRGDFIQETGGGQAVRRDLKTGINYGASDPRKDGAAIPEPFVPTLD